MRLLLLLKQIKVAMLRLKSLLNYRFGYLTLFVLTLSSFIYGNYYASQQIAAVPQTELLELRSENAVMATKLAQSKIDLSIEKNTIAEMNNTQLLLQSEVIEQQLALRFYQKVMAPESTANGVNIENVLVEAGVSKGHYRFEILLAQLEKRRRYIKGSLQLVLIGSVDGKPQQLDLTALIKPTATLKVSFRFFQHINSEFMLPDNFTPEKLKVTIKMPRHRGQKSANVSKEYRWNTLLKIPLKPLLTVTEDITVL